MARRVSVVTVWRGFVAALTSGAVVLASGCAADEAPAPTVVEVPETVAIGRLPGPFSDTTVPLTVPVPAVSSSTTEPEPVAIIGPLVDDVDGHRLLLIGDTVLAATTPRFDGTMCPTATRIGWDVAIEAEPGRFVSFADEVLDARLGDGWDVVGLMFGHHVDTTVDEFEGSLDRVLDRLEARPVILYTVAEGDELHVEVNRIVREQGRARPNVVVIDWADAVADEADDLLEDGGPYPTAEGAARLAAFTAAMLGEVPVDTGAVADESGDDGDDASVPAGQCLDPVFTDDSAIVL